MASKHREEHIIAAVSCPQCGAGIGESCARALRCHAERRQLWLEWKRKQPQRAAIQTTGELAVARLRELATVYACKTLDNLYGLDNPSHEAQLEGICVSIEALTVSGSCYAELVDAKERAKTILCEKHRASVLAKQKPGR